MVLASGDAIRRHALYPAVLVLVLLGAFTKSAQFPFHFWLPRAMAAPTPVSAYLHSATMVKLGVFLLARLWPVLSGTEPWFWLVGGTGAVTLLLGGYVAMFQRDLKALLAYSTISHLGLIMLLLGPEQPAGGRRGGVPRDEPRDLQGVALHGRRHHRPRERHARHPQAQRPAQADADHRHAGHHRQRVDGRRAAAQRLPVEGDVLRRDGVHRGARRWVDWGLPLIATLAGMFSVAYSARFVFDVFFGPPCGRRVPQHAARAAALDARAGRTAGAGLPGGRRRAGLVGRAAARAAAARRWSAATLPAYSLAVWHGFNLPLVMSFVALAGGVVLYLLQRRGRARGGLAHTPLLHRFDGQRMFENLLRAPQRGRPAQPPRCWARGGCRRSCCCWCCVAVAGAGAVAVARRRPRAARASCCPSRRCSR